MSGRSVGPWNRRRASAGLSEPRCSPFPSSPQPLPLSHSPLPQVSRVVRALAHSQGPHRHCHCSPSCPCPSSWSECRCRGLPPLPSSSLVRPLILCAPAYPRRLPEILVQPLVPHFPCPPSPPFHLSRAMPCSPPCLSATPTPFHTSHTTSRSSTWSPSLDRCPACLPLTAPRGQRACSSPPD